MDTRKHIGTHSLKMTQDMEIITTEC